MASYLAKVLPPFFAGLGASVTWLTLAHLAGIDEFTRGWWAGWISLAVWLAALARQARRQA